MSGPQEKVTNQMQNKGTKDRFQTREAGDSCTAGVLACINLGTMGCLVLLAQLSQANEHGGRDVETAGKDKCTTKTKTTGFRPAKRATV